MPKKTDCINYIPPTGKDCELCRIRNDWCVPCETCEQYESFASWLDRKQKNIPPKDGRDMTNDEIFARIASDVEDVEEGMFGIKNVTIWMTKDLFNLLCPKEFVLQNDIAMTTLFGCRIRVVLFPCNGMRWIVGYEGTAEEAER